MSNDAFYDLVDLKTWGEFRKEYLRRNWRFARWAFRGQGDASWPLQTGLERLLGASRLSNARGVEYRLVREFMRRTHHYLRSEPERQDMIEWLALMQHHGAPTRFQDWTYSFDVALHFSLNSPTADKGAIWVIDLDWVRDKVISLLPLDLGREWAQPENRKNPTVISNVLAEQCAFVVAVTPFRLNERLSIQQGTFLLPGNLSVPFEHNVGAMGSIDETRQHIVKLQFSRAPKFKFVEEAIAYLRTVNITEATLFPGLDGFARSLHAFGLILDFDVFSSDEDAFKWALNK